MAQNAELLLKVGLDLSHFRQQLTTIGSQLAGQPLSINIKFDRTKLANEFRLLDRSIRNKKFYVEINTNLEAEIKRADRLVAAIGRVQAAATGAKGGLPIGTDVLGIKKGPGNPSAADIKKLFSAAIQGGLLDANTLGKTRAQMVTALGGIGRDAIAGLLNGLSSGNPQLQAAAKSLGDSLIAALKQALGIASPSKETGKLGKFAAQGFEQGFVSNIVKAERSMARAIRSALMGAIREGFGNLPGMSSALVSFERQLAASVQLAVRKAVRQGLASAITPGAKGGLLGGTGGAITGATVGGAKALGTGVAGGVAKLTAGGLMGMAGNLARYSVDSSAYQEFVGKLYQEIIHAALSTGSQGAIIGALAVGGVAGGLGFARGASGSLILQAVTAIRNRILAALLAVSTGDLNNIVKVMVRDVTGLVFQGTIRQLRAATAQMPAISWPAQLPSRAPAIGPAGTGRLLTGAVPMQALAAAQSPAGLLPAVSQSTARRQSVTSGLQAIFAAGGPTFPEDPPGKLALTAEALKARVDAILAEYFKVVAVTVKEIFDPQDLKKALRVFSFLPQALRDAESRAAGLLGTFGRERTYTGRLQVDPQASSRAYQRLLPPAIMKLLAPAAEIGGAGAQKQVVSAFFAMLRASTQMFAEAFSANSYLPQSTRKLAAAMDSAATALRLLTPAKIAGFLPSRELMDKRKIASAIQKAIVIDMTNALRQQMEGRMLPAAGGTQGFQRMLGDRQPLYRAPGVGPARPKIDMTGKVLPVEERKRFQEALSKAAEIDANNAAKAATIAARNAARAAFIALRQEVNRGLLPAAGQTFASRRKDLGVSGIFDAMTQQMGFGAGQRYAMGGPAQLRLPAAGMTGLGAAQAERVRRAYERSAARGRSVLGEGMGIAGFRRTMGGTGGGVGAGGGGGGRRGGGGGGGGMFGGLPNISLPGSGAIRELGQEFAFATKQVLLFGQAYKLLAFIQDFPAQVGQAVGQLQSFRNTLAAISPNAEEVAASSNLILQLVEQYNIPLQSARDGFTKLYASMQPAGFSGDQIRELFTGVSKAAATFGMSSDKIDRVNYAFAQMASKGQVMSEELKGQLGDVLPGAMAIFAQAAGFTGPEAISTFSAALEDGRYKGAAMMELLNNVSIVLNQKFSKGAEGAAKTFQGAINNMQTLMKALYESFEPIAVNFLNGVVTPVMNGVKIITDGLNVFFSGTRAQTAGGFAFAQQLEALRPTFQGIAQNVQQLVPIIQQFGSILGGVVKIFLQIVSSPIVGYLARIYAIFLPLNIALGAMRGLLASNIAQFLIFNTALSTGSTTLSAFRATMAATGATAQTTGAAIRGAGLTLRTFFASTGIGIVLVGIGLLSERFASMNQRLDETRAKAFGAAQAIRAMSQTEARAAGQQAQSDIKLVQGLISKGGRGDFVSISEREKAAIERLGGAGQIRRKVAGASRVAGRGSLPELLGYGAQGIDPSMLPALIQQGLRLSSESEARVNQVKFEEQQANKPISFAEIKGGSGEGKTGAKGAADKAAREAERAAQQARELEATLEQLREQLKIEGKSLELQEAISFARADGNEKLVNFLQTQETFYNIDEKAAKLQREFAAGKIKQAELSLRQQLLAIERKKTEITEEERLNAILRERYGITNEVLDAARRARENAFGLGLGAGAFRTDMNLMPELTGGELGSKFEQAKTDLAALANSANQVAGAAGSIGSAFGESFKGIVSGSMTAQQALASFFQSIADYFLDMAAKMIAKWLEMKIIGLVASLIPGGSAIFPGGVGNFSGAFGSGGPTFNPSVFTGPRFANGGIVSGPTLGLVGEGRYNEAIVPLPNGRSIPVELGGGMGGVNVVVNVDATGSEAAGNEGQAKALGNAISAAVQSEIIKQKRPGGLLAR